jgi:BirA family transcriptional regulator, biotin operon repressor / biotin---[acetyl-CoA-carboxylase] ligase
MDRVTERASQGAPSGTVVVADYQSRGRGTHGRRWEAQSGTCLMFSVLLRPEMPIDELAHLPLRIAEGVGTIIRDAFDLPVEVSPPNDIVIRGKKVCGVLATSRITGQRLDWVTCGIGINTHMARVELPLDVATSLMLEVSGPLPPHSRLLEMILDSLTWLRGDAPSCAAYTDKPILMTNV